MPDLLLNIAFSGMVYAIDVNRGRLRILKETAKLHQVDGVVTTVHADLRTLTVCYIVPILCSILNSAIVLSYICHFSFFLIFVFPRTVNHLRVTKFCWTHRAQGLAFFQRWFVLIILCLLIVVVFTWLSNVFFFSCLLTCSYHLAFEESGLTLEQKSGRYGRIEAITGWTPRCSIHVNPEFLLWN